MSFGARSPAVKEPEFSATVLEEYLREIFENALQDRSAQPHWPKRIIRQILKVNIELDKEQQKVQEQQDQLSQQAQQMKFDDLAAHPSLGYWLLLDGFEFFDHRKHKHISKQSANETFPDWHRRFVHALQNPNPDHKGFALNLLPDGTYLSVLSQLFFRWIETKQIPVRFEKLHLLNEPVDLIKKHLEPLHLPLLQLASDWHQLKEPTRLQKLTQLVELLGLQGFLTLLGLRHTSSSLRKFLPPSIAVLFHTFSIPHAPPSHLTVGARALAKHTIRDSTGKFWGVVKGTENEVNSVANGCLLRLLAEAVWLNFHRLPNSKVVFEMRCIDGYGARWQVNGPATNKKPKRRNHLKRDSDVKIQNQSNQSEENNENENNLNENNQNENNQNENNQNEKNENENNENESNQKTKDSDEPQFIGEDIDEEEETYSFVGFLEPMMENAFENGYRH